jgi:hypothetical protein
MSEDADNLIINRGRVYVYEKCVSLKVFTREEARAQGLVDSFGGAYYPQGSGYVWTTSNRKDLMVIVQTLRMKRTLFDKLDKLFEIIDEESPPQQQQAL